MWELIKSDLYRYYGITGVREFVKGYIFIPGFHYMVWFRLSQHCHFPILRQFIKWRLFQKSIKFGIEIPPQTSIGKGFYIGHWGGIVVHPLAVIGDNCNISQGVVIGAKPSGVPVIGHGVYMATGAKIIGNVLVGDNVSIGANAVVTKDLPSESVAVGIPAHIISRNGSYDYTINRYVDPLLKS